MSVVYPEFVSEQEKVNALCQFRAYNVASHHEHRVSVDSTEGNQDA